MTEQRPALFVAIVLAAAVVLAALPLVLPPFYIRVGQLMIYSAGLAVAWTILGGFAGYASFGHAAFIGVGAFAAGLAEDRLSGLPVSLMLPIGLVVGGFACAILSAAVAYPILRLRGTFFAIAMLANSNPDLAAKLQAFRQRQTEKVLESQKELEKPLA